MNPATEYAAAWKATLETFFQPCLSLAFPRLADQIDWSAPPCFLDTELLDLVSDRFGPCGDAVRARVDAIQNEARLRALARAVLIIPTLAEFESQLGS